MSQQQRGGPGRGQGRKPVADTPTKHYTVTLDDRTAETVREYGGGNLSAGIRRMAKAIDAPKPPPLIYTGVNHVARSALSRK